MSWLNTLAPWQWAVFLAIPAAIVALYFLKLRRQPVVVPSTYLWTRAIEDLHVNSLWQRLRHNVLLWLQLLVVALAMLACLRPGWRGAELEGDRFIFLVDTSASMSATDVEPNRLEAAKRRVLELIDQMKSGDVALLVSFSDAARVEQSFTDNRSLLRQKVSRIRPTQRGSDLQEALRVASGLANPGRISEDVGDVRVAGALPATVYILSDGGFPHVDDFALGNLRPVYVALGQPQPDNVAIVAFTAERNLERQGHLEAFARVENSGPADVASELTLSIDGRLADASRLAVPAGGESGVRFDLDTLAEGVLTLEWQRPDDLLLDNRAYAVVGTPTRARVLFVTPGNEPLELALTTSEAKRLADVTVVTPEHLVEAEYRERAAAGAYDLVIYDRCVPAAMPEANTLFIGRVPPTALWSQGALQEQPFIVDTDRSHPLTYLVEMGSVRVIYDGFAVQGPAGSLSLFDSSIGPLLVIAQRGGFEDAVLGFELRGEDEQGRTIPKTDWPSRPSFPVFAMNVLNYLGALQGTAAVAGVPPGSPVSLRARSPVGEITVVRPSGETSLVLREGQNVFTFGGTEELGVYQVREGASPQTSQRFPVNLLDSRESNLAPRPEIQLGFETVAAQSSAQPTRRELWKLLLLASLGMLLVEWYVFNRRV